MGQKVRPGFVRTVAIVVTIVCVVGAALATRLARQGMRHAAFEMSILSPAETLYVPSVEVLKVTSLGRQSFMADLLFIRGFSYFVDHLFYDRVFEWLPLYVDTIIALDPKNHRIYKWASDVVKYRQMITNDVIAESNKYAKLGIEQFPDDWRLYLAVGFNLYFEWDYADAEEEAKLKEEALQYFTTASLLPGSDLDPNFVTNLYLAKDDKLMAAMYAAQLYMDASDEERTQLEKRLEAAKADALLEALKEETAEWEATYDYLSPGLFTLVGAPLDTAVPTDWASRGLPGVDEPPPDEE